ncbi:MAG TPA: Hpt domain-containing protein [Bacillota bacterium]|jgi:anti-anti-sigma factor|nr:Hpt domain-containing protein [Bacillota bacterium]HPT67702.1 Hpt domain-containing protein [Bacillota bacterium]
MTSPADELMQIFLAEASENLDAFEDALMRMEAGEHGDDDIREAFRLVHNVKGSSAMVGLHKLSELAHAMEDSLEPIRSKSRELDADLTRQLFNGLALMREIINRPEADSESEWAAKIAAYVKDIRSGSIGGAAAPTAKKTEAPGSADIWAAPDLHHVTAVLADDVVFNDVKARIIQNYLGELGKVLLVYPPVTEENPDIRVYHYLVSSASSADQLREQVEKKVNELREVKAESVNPTNVAAVKSAFGQTPARPAGQGKPHGAACQPSSLSVVIKPVGDDTMISCIGELDGNGLVVLMDVFREQEAIRGDLIMDFSKLNYINSLGLGFLIRLYKMQDKNGKKLRIVGPLPRIRQLLETTNITKLVQVDDRL